MDNKIKRERSVNFNLEERDILVSLVFKYSEIIENKRSDGTTWKNKESTWENIAKEFNARSGGAPRTSKTLRIKYEGLKRSVRKKSAAIRSELYRTGGGWNTAVPLDNTEEKIKSLIKLSCDGLESRFDSDALPQIDTQQSEDASGNLSVGQFIIFPSTSTSTEPEIIENSTIFKEDSEADNIAVLPSTSKESSEAVEDMDMDNFIGKDENTPRTKSTLKWDVTSRRNLKTKKHPSLVANFQKKSIDELTQAKLELVQLQKEILKMEMAEKRKESEFREKQRQWMEEEHLIKLDILRNELNK